MEDVAAGRAVLLDVRTEAEFAGAHAAGAVHFELSRIASGHMPKVGKGDKIYVYCQSGGRASRAAALLARAGFRDVTNIGGILGWSAAGGAIEQSDGPTAAPECEVSL